MKIVNAKKLVDKLVEECSENIDGHEMMWLWKCTQFLHNIHIIVIGISGVFIYFRWYLKKSSSNITNINTGTKTII